MIRAERAGTFTLVCLSWVLFRSSSVGEAAEVFRRIFTMEGGSFPPIGQTELAGAAVRIGILVLLPRVLQRGRPEEADQVKASYMTAVMVFLIAVSMLLVFDSGGGSSFIYFQF